MRLIQNFLLTALALTGALTGGSAKAAPDNVLSKFHSPLQIYHMFSSADGLNHVSEVTLPTRDTSVFSYLFDVKTSRTYLIYRSKGLADWHKSSPRHLTIILRGTYQLDIGDGRTYPLSAGSILFAEDSAGRGHRDECQPAVGEQICLLLVTDLTANEMLLAPAR